MTGPNHIIPGNPEAPSEVPVGTKMESLSGKVVNHGRRVVMGALAGLAMAVSSPAMAQDMVAVKTEAPQGALAPNPEYEKIIEEAKKIGKDPVDYALSKGKSESFAEGLDTYIIKKAAIARRAEQSALDAKSADLSVKINAANIKIINLIEERKRKGILNQADKAKLMEIYDDKKMTSEEVRELIRKKFGDVLKLGDLMARV